LNPTDAYINFFPQVKNVVNINNARLKVTAYHPQNLEYSDNVLWTVAVEEIRVILDRVYTTSANPDVAMQALQSTP